MVSVSTTDTREELAAQAREFLNDSGLRCEGAPFLHRVRAVAPVLRTDIGVRIVIARGVLDEVEPKGSMNATHELGYPFSQQVISFLLGVPYEDHAIWEHSMERMLPLLLGVDTEEGIRQATEATFEFAEYVRGLIAKERERPSGGLFSLLVNAEDEGSRLTEVELVGFAHEVITAGFETVANTTELAIYLLLRHPDQLARLRQDPSLWPRAIEEVLRYMSPGTMTMPRLVTEDVEIGGMTIPKGETVIVLLDGVNRDPEVFPDPDRFDALREDNPHLGFGFGPHFCLGAGLARMELRTLLPMVFERLPDLRLVDEDLHWRKESVFLRVLDRLEVAW